MGGMKKIIYNFYNKFKVSYKDGIYEFAIIKGEHYYVYLYDREFKKFVYKLIKFYIRRGVL